MATLDANRETVAAGDEFAGIERGARCDPTARSLHKSAGGAALHSKHQMHGGRHATAK